MAFDAFLKLAGIKGESLDSKHKDEIEVLSFSFGISNKVSPTGGGGAGKATIEDFRFVKNVDTASPDLFDATCSGKPNSCAPVPCRRKYWFRQSAPIEHQYHYVFSMHRALAAFP
jgi:type VI secretion system secreted protein Hcp